MLSVILKYLTVFVQIFVQKVAHKVTTICLFQLQGIEILQLLLKLLKIILELN